MKLHILKVNSQSVSKDNRDNKEQQTATNPQQGADINKGSTYRQQNTGPVFGNSEQSESREPVSEADRDNTNQEQGININKQQTDRLNPTEGNNENSDTSTQSENPTQGNDVTSKEGSFENNQVQTKPLSKGANSNLDTNNKNIQGRFSTQNENDGSSISEDTLHVNSEQDNVGTTNDNSNSGVNDVNNNHPENTLNEGTKQPWQNSNEAKNPQTSSNSLQSRPDSALEATGKPEYITAQEDKPQSEITHAWSGDTGDATSQENDQGKDLSRPIQHKTIAVIIL